MKNNRKKFLIYPEIQMPLLYMGITLILIVTLIQLLTLIIFIYKYRYGDIGFNLDTIKEVIFNIFYYRAGLLLFLLVPLLLTVFFFARYFLFISNKYAGPIYKIEMTLDEIAKTGQLEKPIQIRSTDFLIKFVDKLNLALQKMNLEKKS